MLRNVPNALRAVTPNPASRNATSTAPVKGRSVVRDRRARTAARLGGAVVESPDRAAHQRQGSFLATVPVRVEMD
jgi:hypothetical protein